MPTPSTNCYTIASTKSLADGVPLEEGILLSVMGGVPLVYLGGTCAVWLGEGYGNGTNIPERNATHLLRARVTMVSSSRKHPRLVSVGPRAPSLIVHIISERLCFNLAPLTDSLNLWPGGDGDIRPFLQFGEHKNGQDKQQLFNIPNERSIFVVDENRALIRLTSVDGKPMVSQPEIPELVEFLLERAKAQRKVQALDWSLHNLRALLKIGTHGDLIRNAISELSRLRETA